MEAEYGEGILGAGHSVHHPPLTRAAPVHGTSMIHPIRKYIFMMEKPIIYTFKSLW
jgi:hypothetical protein